MQIGEQRAVKVGRVDERDVREVVVVVESKIEQVGALRIDKELLGVSEFSVGRVRERLFVEKQRTPLLVYEDERMLRRRRLDYGRGQKLASQRVENGGFADVRTALHADEDRKVLRRLELRQEFGAQIEQDSLAQVAVRSGCRQLERAEVLDLLGERADVLEEMGRVVGHFRLAVCRLTGRGFSIAPKAPDHKSPGRSPGYSCRSDLQPERLHRSLLNFSPTNNARHN